MSFFFSCVLWTEKKNISRQFITVIKKKNELVLVNLSFSYADFSTFIKWTILSSEQYSLGFFKFSGKCKLIVFIIITSKRMGNKKAHISGSRKHLENCCIWRNHFFYFLLNVFIFCFFSVFLNGFFIINFVWILTLWYHSFISF